MASLRSIYRQIETLGKRWGLVPVMRGDRVGVAQLVPSITRMREGSLVVITRVPQVIMSFDERSPLDAFQAFMRVRVKRAERDFAKRCADQRRARAERAALEIYDSKEQTKREFRRRHEKQRIISVPGMWR